MTSQSLAAALPVIERPSPNCDARPEGQAVDILLLHYTGMKSAGAALARMCDAAARVSAHYCIDEGGEVFRLVPEARRAWHSGQSRWAGAANINDRSLGIELVNPGHAFGYRPFPEAQMASLAALARDLLTRHAIRPARVLGHSDVAPLRKEDPGELFDWPGLARAGIGIFPFDAAPAEPDEAAARSQLAAIGYGYLEEDFAAVLRAFQRRFRPADPSGALDAESAGLIARQAALVKLDGGAARA